jgi:phosphoserine phosphatase RsbU/P
MTSTPVSPEKVNDSHNSVPSGAVPHPDSSQDVTIAPSLVKSEFTRNTEKFHVIACWVGIILNLVWFAGDIVVLPDHWKQFFEWRIAVSVSSLIVLLFRHKLAISIYACVFFLVLGISIQNAYMWNVMDLAHMQKHAFAYMALFIGVGMLVLWEFWFSVILVVANIIANFIFYELWSPLSPDEFLINGGLLMFTVAIFMIFLIRQRYRLTIREITSRLQLEKSKEIIEQERNIVVAQNHEIERQKDELAEINKEIKDSINYAKRIQSSFIPTEEAFVKHFKDAFVLFQPKDIVSGDFYWLYEHSGRIFYATADCTGHGVPGGFMTMLGLSFLEEIVEIKGETQVNEILNYLRDRIVTTLKQTGNVGENKDGMDIAMCCIEPSKKMLTYSAANNSVYIYRNADLIELKPDKQPVGFYHEPKPFTAKQFPLEEGDVIYTFTDGYADQFGGPNGKKFKYRKLEDMLTQNSKLPFSDQKKILSDAINNWMANTYQQIDDILVIGVKPL